MYGSTVVSYLIRSHSPRMHAARHITATTHSFIFLVFSPLLILCTIDVRHCDSFAARITAELSQNFTTAIPVQYSWRVHSTNKSMLNILHLIYWEPWHITFLLGNSFQRKNRALAAGKWSNSPATVIQVRVWPLVCCVMNSRPSHWKAVIIMLPLFPLKSSSSTNKTSISQRKFSNSPTNVTQVRVQWSVCFARHGQPSPLIS